MANQPRHVPSWQKTSPTADPAAPSSSEQAELRSTEPHSVAERVGRMLDAASDGPVTTFLAEAVKGAAGAPITRLVGRGLGAMTGAHTGRAAEGANDFDDFLTTISAKTIARPGSEAGRLVGGIAPEIPAYFAAAGVAQSLGAHGVRMAARSGAIQKYFQALSDPRLPGLTKPVIVRAAEILGSGVGTGALAGGEAAATGQPDPLRTALEIGALSIGLEGAFTVGAKAISRGAREVSKQAIAQRWAGSPARTYLQTAESEFRTKLIKQSARVGKAVNEEIVEKQLQGMAPLFVATPRAAKQYAKAQAAGLAEATGNRVEAVRKLHQASGSLQVARKYSKISEQEILAGAYLSERPTNFDTTFGSLRKAWRLAGATPDAIRKEIGVAGEAGLRSVDSAVLLGFGRWNSSLEMLQRIEKNVEGVVGKKLSAAVLHDLEDGGEALVRSNLGALGFSTGKADQVMRQLDLATGGGDALHEIVVRMGGEPAIDAAKMGVSRYLPHMVRRGKMNDADFAKASEAHLVKKGFTPEEATRRTLDVLEARKARGFQRFGSIDDRRKIPGTTREKIAAGLPMEADPWKALSQYYGGMHQRIALSQVLGFKNEMLPKLVHAVEAEAGPGAASLFRSNIEAVAGLKYYNRLGEQFASSITNLEAAAKMGFSFVPNAPQFMMNNPLVFGLRNTFEGIKSMATQHVPRDLQQSFGFMATDFFDLGLRSTMMNDMAEGITAKLARATLRWTPFNMTEKFNRGTAAFGGHAVLTDILAKVATGRMRGERLTFARKVFEEAGLDLGRVVRDGLSQEEYITGALRLMRRTQFSAGEGTRAIRPVAWQHPLGRVLFQFNTFTLNQGRLMRDFVFNEIARGNKKQLARFLGIYLPTADVSVATQNAVREAVMGDRKERPAAPVVRAIEDIIFAGSFGMANTMFWAAKGGKMEKLLGPAVTDFFTYGEALMDGRFAEIGSRIISLPSVRYFMALAAIGHMGGEPLLEAAEKYVEAADADDPENSRAGGEALTLKDFREAEAAKPLARRRPSWQKASR